MLPRLAQALSRAWSVLLDTKLRHDPPGLTKRRGRDLNPRRTQEPETVFETDHHERSTPLGMRGREDTAHAARQCSRQLHPQDRTARSSHVTFALHECRHTFASLMIDAGVNAKALSTYMDHSSITITLDRYGHLFPGNEDEAAELLDAYLEANTKARLAQVT
jgi:integrase